MRFCAIPSIDTAKYVLGNLNTQTQAEWLSLREGSNQQQAITGRTYHLIEKIGDNITNIQGKTFNQRFNIDAES